MVTAHDMLLLVYFTIFIIVIIASPHTAGYILRIVSTISIVIIYC